MEFWIITAAGILAFGAWIWYYASLGKRISSEEKEAGRDLTYETNPFTGSPLLTIKKGSKNNKKSI